jgi:hypothetical protein
VAAIVQSIPKDPIGVAGIRAKECRKKVVQIGVTSVYYDHVRILIRPHLRTYAFRGHVLIDHASKRVGTSHFCEDVCTRVAICIDTAFGPNIALSRWNNQSSSDKPTPLRFFAFGYLIHTHNDQDCSHQQLLPLAA